MMLSIVQSNYKNSINKTNKTAILLPKIQNQSDKTQAPAARFSVNCRHSLSAAAGAKRHRNRRQENAR
ncbi:MAG: hypothetical protein J0I91_06650 [Candidatus Accumulibacter sp.]|nr:hypothetical protein [Accumulibacter sp.]